MEDQLLTTLRDHQGTFVSGEELSRHSGVSRAAIWKQIERMREEGYQIAAQPHLGYRLVAPPDRLIPDELTWRLPTAVIGRKVYSFASTDSTMDVAHRLAAAGEPEGSVIFAEAQRQGRGRLGRTWVSPGGQGIYLSVILRPRVTVEAVPLITIMAAVAVAKAVEEQAGVVARIKWPNDLMIHGRKVAGILTELHAELNQVHAVVLGIGVNANTAKTALPRLATSLAVERGARCDRLALARALLVALDDGYAHVKRHRFQPLLAAWRAGSMTLGHRVRVTCADRHVDGQAVDLDARGALRVRTDEGRMESITAGEVLIVR